ncbi:MAG: ribosome biogenesis GTPase Der [Gammaproteobacteria bacterium]
MNPVFALIGQPNVGKSTLFNRLTQSRDALVADQPGLTRDRLVGQCLHHQRPFTVVDTGGLSGEAEGVDSLMGEQSMLAARQADAVLFLVDGRRGVDPRDEEIGAQLRRLGIAINLLVNKTEGVPRDQAISPFHTLGFKRAFAISASRGDGVEKCIDEILREFPEAPDAEAPIPSSSPATEIDNPDATSDEPALEDVRQPRVAFIGRPNVGKSTLTNQLLGEERVIAFDQPGTTRDSIAIPLVYRGEPWTLIDTAGVRRRARVTDTIEKFSIIKTLQAIEAANAVVVLADAGEGLTDQDVRIVSLAANQGRALVLAINKWDSIDDDRRTLVKKEVERKLPFLSYARVHYISALRGKGLAGLMESVKEAYESAFRDMATPVLNDILALLVRRNPPPLSHGRRPKPRYAHQGSTNPPTIVVHGNQCDRLPDSYTRYLENGFRKHLALEGSPLRVLYRQSENPYAGRKNKPTGRQIKKSIRNRKFFKKKKN